MWPWQQKQRKDIMVQLDMERIPCHIAIIMDGNGRWAKQRNLPRSMGHRAGVEAIRNIVKECSRLGVKVLTVFAFSTENWRRPKEEVGVLMNLLTEFLRREINDLHNNRVVVRAVGAVEELPMEAQKELAKAYERTQNNTGLILNIALNYGGRAELVEAVRRVCREVQSHRLEIESINEDVVNRYLYTAELPDPDLLIRTSGEMRLSNFLLWQSAYTEIVVVEEFWPDFDTAALQEAILIYQQRDRRFGGIKDQGK